MTQPLYRCFVLAITETGYLFYALIFLESYCNCLSKLNDEAIVNMGLCYIVMSNLEG